jgi:hypothetical protein
MNPRDPDLSSETTIDQVAVASGPWDTLPPRAGVPIQLAAATVTWLAGASFLLVRGVLFTAEPGQPFHITVRLLVAALIGVSLGLIKARLVLRPYALRAADRIRARGRSFLLGFFAARSWLLIAVMMGLGIAARHSVLAQDAWGREFLSALYLAVGTALLAAAGVLAAAFAVEARRS